MKVFLLTVALLSFVVASPVHAQTSTPSWLDTIQIQIVELQEKISGLIAKVKEFI